MVPVIFKFVENARLELLHSLSHGDVPPELQVQNLPKGNSFHTLPRPLVQYSVDHSCEFIRGYD